MSHSDRQTHQLCAAKQNGEGMNTSNPTPSQPTLVTGSHATDADFPRETDMAGASLQRSSQRDARNDAPSQRPIQENGTPLGNIGAAENGPRCVRCGDQVPTAVERCPKCGSFVSGNQAARTTGIYARQKPADVLMSADEFHAGLVSDLGGHDELSTAERAYARHLADIYVVISLLKADIVRNGLHTASGARVRDSFDKLMTAYATFDRFAGRLGLKRRAKRVPTLEEVLRG